MFVPVAAYSQKLTEGNQPMKAKHQWAVAVLNRSRLQGCIISGTALACFAAGSFATAGLTHLAQVRAASNRIFQLRVYHAVPGKVQALESRFREASKLLAKHDLNVVGYWVSEDNPAWDNTFIYIVASSSRDEAKKNWDGFHADPAFQEYVKSEQANKLVEKVDATYMRPTDFSPMR
jgi:NIPSNAP